MAVLDWPLCRAILHGSPAEPASPFAWTDSISSCTPMTCSTSEVPDQAHGPTSGTGWPKKKSRLFLSFTELHRSPPGIGRPSRRLATRQEWEQE
jgi:hypothetical protein